MKKIYNIIMCALAALFVFASCDKNDDCALNLSGSCLIQEIALDDYAGTIDLTSRIIVVRVPENCNTSAMKVTKLKISDGATADIAEGQILCMDDGQNINVKSNDINLNWTITVLRDEAKILTFEINDIYPGIIDEENKKIVVYVPGTVNITNAIPTIHLSVNATVDPASGSTVDFSHPVTFNVTNNTASSSYVVTVNVIDKPKALFVGAASDMTQLDPEAREACLWMLSNVSESMYASFADIKAEVLDLSECKIIWWHYHKDGGVDGHDRFVENAPEALEATNQLRDFYENGGSFLLTRYATNLASFIGATGDDEWTTPNNCWGQNEAEAEVCGGPWDFKKYDASHPLFANTIDGDAPDAIYCTDKGYHITNSTAQYHIGADWGDYPTHAAWVTRTGGKIIGVGGDGAIVAWEYPAKDGKGGIICIGSGCYDWYSYMYEEGYEEKFHKNIAIMTTNAINYLTK